MATVTFLIVVLGVLFVLALIMLYQSYAKFYTNNEMSGIFFLVFFVLASCCVYITIETIQRLDKIERVR